MFVSYSNQTVNLDRVSCFFVAGYRLYFCGSAGGNEEIGESYVTVFNFKSEGKAREIYEKIMERMPPEKVLLIEEEKEDDR